MRLLISNSGSSDETLTGVATDVAGVAEVHRSVDEAGVTRMRPLAGGIVIPAGGDAVLEPGGYHLMLIGLTRSLEPGTTFAVTLEFPGEGRVVALVNVSARAPEREAGAALVSGDLSISSAWARPAPMLTSKATPAAAPAPAPKP